MSKRDVCCWCPQIIEIPDNQKMGITPCSTGCKHAEILFRMWMSDEEQNRRAHYHAMTRGDEYGQD